MHAMTTGLAFSFEVGPIADADHLVVRWRACGAYSSGLPGASDAAVGRKVNFTGTDVLRVANGLLAEY